MVVEAALLSSRLGLLDEVDQIGRAELTDGLQSFISIFNGRFDFFFNDPKLCISTCGFRSRPDR